MAPIPRLVFNSQAKQENCTMDMNDANNGDEDMTDDEAAAYCASWDADAASQQAQGRN